MRWRATPGSDLIGRGDRRRASGQRRGVPNHAKIPKDWGISVSGGDRLYGLPRPLLLPRRPNLFARPSVFTYGLGNSALLLRIAIHPEAGDGNGRADGGMDMIAHRWWGRNDTLTGNNGADRSMATAHDHLDFGGLNRTACGVGSLEQEPD